MEIVSRVHSLAATVAAELPRAGDVPSLEPGDELALLGELSALRQSVDAAISLVASDIERKSARELGAESLARREGLKSGAELVQRLTGSSLRDARKAVRVGVMLETAQSVAPAEEATAATGRRSLEVLGRLGGSWAAPIAVAVRNGWLSSEQGDRISGGLGSPRDSSSDPLWRDACLRLIADCWAGELTAEDVARAAKAMRACLDQAWAQENAARLYEQRALRRAVRADGMVRYDLLLDPATDAQVWTPIFRHLAPRLGGPRFMTEEERVRAAELELDSRSNEQLLVDTLTSFLIAGVTASDVFGRYAPTVNIAVTTGELTKAIAHPFDGLAWLDGKPEPVGGAQLLAALCDGAVAGLLFDETGQALDVTKAERTFSPRQRRAMALRDGGCLFPGCTMPPAACEAHHCNPWSESESNHRTETRDGVLLCRFHHLSTHHNEGRVERRESSYWLHWPGRERIRLLPKHGVITQLRSEGLHGSHEAPAPGVGRAG